MISPRALFHAHGHPRPLRRICPPQIRNFKKALMRMFDADPRGPPSSPPPQPIGRSCPQSSRTQTANSWVFLSTGFYDAPDQQVLNEWWGPVRGAWRRAAPPCSWRRSCGPRRTAIRTSTSLLMKAGYSLLGRGGGEIPTLCFFGKESPPPPPPEGRKAKPGPECIPVAAGSDAEAVFYHELDRVEGVPVPRPVGRSVGQSVTGSSGGRSVGRPISWSVFSPSVARAVNPFHSQRSAVASNRYASLVLNGLCLGSPCTF